MSETIDLVFLESRCKELTAADWKQLDRWLQQQPVEAAKAACEALPGAPDLQKLFMERAADRVQGISFVTYAGQEIVRSVAGTAYYLWLCMRKADPQAQLAYVESIVTLANAASIVEMLDKVNKLDALKSSAGADPTTGANQAPSTGTSSTAA